MDRRQFLRTTAASAAIVVMTKALRADDEATVSARLTVQPGRPGHRMAKDFPGLSYETRQLAQPEFFSRQNTGLTGVGASTSRPTIMDMYSRIAALNVTDTHYRDSSLNFGAALAFFGIGLNGGYNPEHLRMSQVLG